MTHLLVCHLSLRNDKSCNTGILQYSMALLETLAPNLVTLTRLSFEIFGQTQTGIFPISGFLVSHDIDMKLEPVTKLDKRNTSTLKKIDYDVMSGNCDIIIFFSDLYQVHSNLEAGFRMHVLQKLHFH